MKAFNPLKSFLLITMLSLLNLAGFSQDLIPVKSSIDHQDKSRACWEVHIDPEPKTVKKAWEDFLKDEYDFHIKGIGFLANKEILSAEEVVVKAISTKKLDFYTQVIEDKNGSQMKVFAAFGYDIYLDDSTHPKEFNSMRQMLEQFIKTYIPKYHGELVATTQKRLEELKDEQEDLKKDIQKDKDEIKDLEKEVEELSERLENNQSLLKETEEKLKSRSDKLERVKKAVEGI